MMIKKEISAALILLLILIAGCGHKITPARSDDSLNNRNSPDYERFYVEAVKQKLMGNTGEALRYLEMCISMNQAADAAYFQIAQILASTDDFNNAKKYALKAAQYDSKNLWYLMVVSQLYYREANLDSAIIWHEKAVKNSPDNENILLTLGNLYIENRQYEKANSIFDSFDKKYGVNDASTISSIRSLIASGKYQEAKSKIEILLNVDPDNLLYNGILAEIYSIEGNKDEALRIYDLMLDKNPGNGQVLLAMSEFLAEQKDYNKLFNILNTIAINEDIKSEEKVSFFSRLVENVDAGAENINRLTLALMVLESTEDNNNLVPLLRTELMAKMGKMSEAVARLEEIIKVKPENYFAWEKLLLTYYELKDFEKLSVKGAECATKFNTSFFAKVLYATGAFETGKYEVALGELKKAEILADQNIDLLMQVYTIRADVYYRNKEFSKAFDTYEQAIKINSNDITVLNNYAYYLAEQNINLKEAEVLAKRVIETEKNNTTFLDTYGWVLFKRGKYNEAAKVFEQIIGSKEEPDAEWFEHYGYILQKQKKCIKAIESWEKALRLDSSKNYLKKEIENCEK